MLRAKLESCKGGWELVGLSSYHVYIACHLCFVLSLSLIFWLSVAFPHGFCCLSILIPFRTSW
ncbi:hypothetical protein BDW42DRAFT_160961 [Aspergillus taichungensis]|uniref:Uncharacterized protein n=1 Tax=Aspergillus taichungensis TaxID=482145 RepID=A0A2J5I5X6_9EURO|nr:hypothetical protein BDW42DRAFT_160961 [Aspergillus taichungensis]